MASSRSSNVAPTSELPQSQVVVEEAQRRPQREGVEPEADLGQFHGHRVEIDAVDAALQDVPLEQVDVGQLVRIDRDALLAEGFQDAVRVRSRAKLTGLIGNWLRNLSSRSVMKSTASTRK